MDQDKLSALLEGVAAGQVSIADALEQLRHLPVSDLEFAKLDTHRGIRTGFPEVVFGLGKTPEQIAGICARLLEHHARILATRIYPAVAAEVLERVPGLQYHADARALTAGYRPRGLAGPEGTGDSVAVPATGVAVVCAGTADIPVAAEAALTVEMRGLAVDRIYDVGVAGLHRILDARPALARARAIVVVAGMEGALPSVVGGLVDRPVIAVPTSVGYGASFGGLAALLGMLNSCAAGVSVVNIDNGFGAGYLAGLIAENAAKP